jgi:hemoglobin-like flavoprotein/cytoskeletal protein CcmA (bactofilin family)
MSMFARAMSSSPSRRQSAAESPEVTSPPANNSGGTRWGGALSPFRRGSKAPEPDHVIGAGAVVEEGTFTWSGLLRVDGILRARLIPSGDNCGLIVGSEGLVEGDVKGLRSVCVSGRIKGSVQASRVILKKKAEIQGGIESPSIVTEAAANLNINDVTPVVAASPGAQKSAGVCPYRPADKNASNPWGDGNRDDQECKALDGVPEAMTEEFKNIALLLRFDDDDTFQKYLVKEYAQENLNFWKTAAEFRAAEKGERNMAEDIYKRYLEESSPEAVNISAGTAAAINESLKNPSAIVRKDLFDSAVREVETLMTLGPFPRFADEIIDNVEGSWNLVKSSVPSLEDAGELFYTILFDMAPGVKKLFTRDKRAQGLMLMSMVDSAIILLKDLESLVPVLVDLGVRHRDYNTKASHYAVVGQALVKTLEKALGDKLTKDITTSWLAVYTLISKIMISTLPPEEEPSPAPYKRGSAILKDSRLISKVGSVFNKRVAA